MDVISNKWVRDVGPLMINTTRMYRYFILEIKSVEFIDLLFFELKVIVF